MLDPQRIGLNAASVGFLARTGQKVDWASFNQALQTDDSRVADVRATVETPVDELHVMGGQRFGLEGNSNLKMNARQERQINGYPLRSFSAEAPSIILPDKYGGLPMYTRNQTEYKDFVSSFTAPLSAVLQNDTVLLSRQGYSVTNESASQPYRDVGFEHNMHKSKSAIDYNTALINQRRWLQIQSREARQQKFGNEVSKRRAMGQKEVGGIVIPADNSNRGMGDGVFIGADGRPMTQVLDEADGDQLAQATLEMKPQPVPRTPYVPGTNMPTSSSDDLKYNSTGASSWITTTEALARGFNREGQDMSQVEKLDYFDFQTLKGGFAAARNAIAGRKAHRGSFAAVRDSIETRAASTILNTALTDRPSFSNRVSNTEFANNYTPLRSERLSLGSPSFTPSGNQARSLYSGTGALGDPDFVGSPMRQLWRSVNKPTDQPVRDIRKSQRSRTQTKQFRTSPDSAGGYKGQSLARK